MSATTSCTAPGGPLRVSLITSGGASQGAFEAGAVSALLAGLAPRRDRGPTVAVDLLTGVSAGAVTTTLAGHCLATGTGTDAPYRLHQAWVRRASLRAMLRGARRAPLSLARVAGLAHRYVAGSEADTGLPGPVRPGGRPVRLQLALGALAGTVGGAAGDPPTVPNHLGWAVFDVSARTPVAEWSEVLAATGAAAANPYAFGPALVRPSIAPGAGPDGDAPQWCTDGGPVAGGVLARAIDQAGALDERAGAGRRLHVLIHPYSPEPPARAWRDAGARPGWLDTIGRVGELQRAQALRDDLDRVARANDGAAGAAKVAGALSRLDPASKGRLLADLGGSRAGGADVDAELGRLLREALGVGARPETVHTLSPRLLVGEPGEHATRARELLSGAFLGGFGGFASERLRQSDFDLGYRCGLVWLRERESRGELPEGTTHAAGEVYLPGQGHRRTGGATLRDLRPGELVPVAHLAGRAARLAVAGACDGRRHQAAVERRASGPRPGRRRLGPPKRLHGTGTVFAGRFEPRAGTPLSPLFLAAGDPAPDGGGLAAMARFSRTHDLPVLRRFVGLAVKIELAPGDGARRYSDLLMVSSSPTRLGRKWGAFASGDVLQAFYGSLLAIEVGGRRLLVGARTVGAAGPCSFAELCAGASVLPLHVELLVAAPGGDWRAAGELTLTRQLIDDRRRLRFSPARSGLSFTLPRLNRLRTGVYRCLQPSGTGVPVGVGVAASRR